MEQEQPKYKIYGKKRQELKFISDCMRRIHKFYLNPENKDLVPGNEYFLFTGALSVQNHLIENKLQEKYLEV